MAPQQKSTSKFYIVDIERELRFEVDGKNKKIILELKMGFAEIFGSELVMGKKYEFRSGAKVAVFTYHGCKLKITGQMDSVYTSNVTPMHYYANCHAALDNMRLAAVKERRRGPVLMIVGSSDVGKSSVSRILLNYGVKMGRQPMYVDLDVSGGHISVPGTIGAISVQRPSDVVDGFDEENPLVFHFGHTTPSTNITLYNNMVSCLAKECLKRLQPDKKSKTSDIIINTHGLSDKDEFQILTHATQAFEVDVILVLDNEKLHSKLKQNIPESVRILSIPKSCGVVKCNETRKAAIRDQRIQKYFYGSRIKIRSYNLELKWNQLKIYKIGAINLPASCMPIGMKVEDHASKLLAVSPGPHLLHHLLSIVSVKDQEKDKIIEKNVIGFYCVTKVDVVRRSITVLSPQPLPLPNTVLIFSSIQFMDN